MKSIKARAAQLLAWPSIVGGQGRQVSRPDSSLDDRSIASQPASSTQRLNSSASTKVAAGSSSHASGGKTARSAFKLPREYFTAKHDRRILLMALASGFPAVLIALILLWNGDQPARVQWTLSVLIIGFWLGFSHALRERVVFPLQTLSNLLAALREGDFSIRARGAARDDPLGEAMLEVNFLGQILREQRLGALEATTLLRTVMAEIEVAIFAFDADQKLKLVNRAGERLLAQPAERLIGKSATDLGLVDCLSGETTRTLQMSFPREIGRASCRERV